MKPALLLMGQLPPPWHGQAVATQMLFDYDWPDIEVCRLAMEYSRQMDEVGRFSLRKIFHVVDLAGKASAFLRRHPGATLLYPPASAHWLPFLRDVVFLCATRRLAGRRVFLYHASGLAEWCSRSRLRMALARMAYGGADHSLEVSREDVPPHRVFEAKAWSWCPCGVDVPRDVERQRSPGGKTRVLFVGSLQEGKGVLELLRTAASLKEQGRGGDFEFEVVGNWFSNAFRREALALRHALDVADMVTFAGPRTGDAKWQAYADADVFFFPTHYPTEGSPIVLMEAMGMGMPIVSTRWRGIPAMLEGSPDCLLYDGEDIAGFCAGLDELARSPQSGSRARYFELFTR